MSANNDDRVYGAIEYANTDHVSAVVILVITTIALINVINHYLGKLMKLYEVHDIFVQCKYKLLGM
jgi:Na+/proline symporter